MKWSVSITIAVAEIKCYEIYYYTEEIPSVIPSPELWEKIGIAMALPLPMGCNIGKVKVLNTILCE